MTERRFGEEWWEEVGEIGVDSGTVFLGDPAYIAGNLGEIAEAQPAGHELWEQGYTLVSPAPWSAMGVIVQSGLGDGRTESWCANKRRATPAPATRGSRRCGSSFCPTKTIPRTPVPRNWTTEVYCPPYTPMADVIPEGKSGDFAVEHFEMTREQVSFEHLMAAARGNRSETYDLRPGRYCRLRDLRHVWDSTVMTDTPMERRTCLPVVEHARGDVLVAGLGLGMVLLPILSRTEVGCVTVIERSPDVIALVEPALRRATGRRAENGLVIECADIFEWQPPRGQRWATLWFDIWSAISGSNYEGMKRLHRKFAGRRAPGGFMESWRRADCRSLSR